jgi:COP9 signalosome complex subunit 1
VLSVVKASVQAAHGLISLADGAYEAAAHILLGVPVSLGAGYATVVHVAEVALYAAVTALATFTRDDLKARVLSGPGKALLELQPAMRDVIAAYVGFRYADCLRALNALKVRSRQGGGGAGRGAWQLVSLVAAGACTPTPLAPRSQPELSLDMFLQRHVEALVRMVRHKALQQYLLPYTTARITDMAAAFSTT